MSESISKANESLCMKYGHIPHEVIIPHNGYTYCERCGCMIDAPHEKKEKE